MTQVISQAEWDEYMGLVEENARLREELDIEREGAATVQAAANAELTRLRAELAEERKPPMFEYMAEAVEHGYPPSQSREWQDDTASGGAE